MRISRGSYWASPSVQKMISLRAAAKVQSDSYYRYWFVLLADKLDEALTSAAAGSFNFGFQFNHFRDLFAAAFIDVGLERAGFLHVDDVVHYAPGASGDDAAVDTARDSYDRTSLP